MRTGILANGEAQDFYYLDDHPTMPGWFKGRLSYKNVVYGLLKVLVPNVKGSNVNPGALIAVAVVFFSHSLILWLKSHSSKSLLRREGTFATSTLSTTVNSTSSSSTGVPRNFITAHRHAQQILKRWKKMSWFALMMCHCCRYGGTFSCATLCSNTYQLSRSYANQSARFISAYAQGLSGAQAVWANPSQKYHGPADTVDLMHDITVVSTSE